MALTVGIYKLTSPSGSVYIGQSISIEKRFSKYRNMNCKGQSRLYYSMLHHGVDKFSFEIIHALPENPPQVALDFFECSYIAYYKSIGTSMLNLKDGGHHGVRYSKESRQRMSESHKGRVSSFKGKKHSAESILKMKDTLSKLDLTGANARCKREVINTSTGKIYPTVKAAADAAGVKRTTLGMMLAGNNKNYTNMEYSS